jgi:hypothetical protein
VGFLETSMPDGTTTVQETFTCCHCNKLTRLPVGVSLKMAPVDMCRHCNKRTCSAWVCRDRCAPTEKRMAAFERRVNSQQAREAFLRAVEANK